MKKYVRLLCVALVLALLTQLAPVPALAASKITLKSGAAAPSTIYTGHSYSLKVAGTAVKFYTSNKAVATIGATTGKLKAVKPGSVKVTAKSKKTGKAVATKTFKVLQRATAITTNVDSLLMKPKDTAQLTATLTPETSTDAIRFYSSDKTVATVGMTSGKVTAVHYGETEITVYAKATKATANASKYNKVAIVKVRVTNYIDEASITDNGTLLRPG